MPFHVMNFKSGHCEEWEQRGRFFRIKFVSGLNRLGNKARHTRVWRSTPSTKDAWTPDRGAIQIKSHSRIPWTESRSVPRMVPDTRQRKVHIVPASGSRTGQ